jgi:putative endonuclease
VDALPPIGPAPPQRHRPRARDGRRTLARLGEELADAHLRRLGFAVLARNVRSRGGEIDLIACDGRALVFAEVKTRRVPARQRGIRPDQEPLAALRPRQRLRLRSLAAAWLRERAGARPNAPVIRFDAIGVIVDDRDTLLRIDHLPGAW